jgi:hypothetical protein
MVFDQITQSHWKIFFSFFSLKKKSFPLKMIDDGNDLQVFQVGLEIILSQKLESRKKNSHHNTID